MRIASFEKWSLLAGFRFLLALIVAVGHLGPLSAPSALLAIAWLNPFHAILGFLLVSGYSVGCSYLVASEGFLKRRILRIYPIYAASLVMAVTVWITIFHGKFPKWEIVAANLFFLNQILTNFSLIGPAWSLSLEFWLYCLLPFLFRRSPSVLRTLCYGSFVSYLVYTFGRSAFHWPYYCNTSLGLNLPLLSFVWICGLRLADPRSRAEQVFLDLRVFFIGQILLETAIEMISRLRHHNTFGTIMMVIPHELMHAATLCVTYLLFRRHVLTSQNGRSRSDSLRILGDIAYPLYLVHIPVFQVLHSFGIRNSYLLLISALSMAALFYLLLDRYSQRRHLRPSIQAKPDAGNPVT